MKSINNDLNRKPAKVIDLLSEADQKVPLIGVSAKATIAGSGARVLLRQRFRNDETVPVEAVYKFPLPADSAVCGFRIETGGKLIKGTAEDREKAYKIYDTALEKGDSASLLEQERPNLFTLSVGNLVPGQEAVIELEFVTRLEYRGDAMRFFLPATIGPRYVPAGTPDKDGIPVDSQVNPPFALTVPYGVEIEVTVENSSSLKSVNPLSHRLKTAFEGDKTVMRLSGGLAPLDRDFILDLLFKDEAQSRALYSSDENYSYLGVDFALPAPAAKTVKKTASEIVFVLDCSGSMDGSSIIQSKQALLILLKALEAGKMFNIYRFGNQFEKLFTAAKAMDEETLALSTAWLGRVTADLGGTVLMGPLADIYALPSKSRDIVVLTDGDIGNEDAISGLAKAKTSVGARLHLVGIGSGPNEHLLKSASRAGNGLSVMIAPEERIEPPMLRLYGALKGGCLTDVTADCGVKGAEAAGLPSVIFTGGFDSFYLRLPKGKMPGSVELAGNFAGKKKAFKLDTAAVADGLAPLSVLWARAKVRELESAGQEAKAVAIALQYNLASAGTSFVGVQVRKAGEKSGDIALRKVPVMIPAGWGAVCEEEAHSYIGCKMVSAPSSRSSMSMSMMCMGINDSMEHPPRSSNRVARSVVRSSARMYNPVTFPPSQQQDYLLSILTNQRLNGGFDPDEGLFNLLGLDWGKFEKALSNASPAEKALAFTMVVLAALTAKYAARRSEWEPMLEKTMNWVVSESANAPVKILGRPLQAWVNKLVRG